MSGGASACEKSEDRSFFVRSRDRRSVTQIVRERYVRWLPCMADECTACSAHPLLQRSVPRPVAGRSALWLVPGVTCCAHYGELLQRARDVVLLQSVLSRAAELAPSAVRGVRAWAKDATHRWGVLLNECHEQLALTRAHAAESDARLALRRLVHACLWLADHGVACHGAPRRLVLLISDNADVRQCALDFGVQVCSVRDLLDLLWPGDASALDLYAALAEKHAAADAP